MVKMTRLRMSLMMMMMRMMRMSVGGKQAEEMTMVRGNDSDDGSFSRREKGKSFLLAFPLMMSDDD